MNFHINTKALEALSYADLHAIAKHLQTISNLRNSNMSHVIPANFTIDACKELSLKVFNATTQKIQQQNIINFFKGDSIENKPIKENEISTRSINTIRAHFGLNEKEDVTVSHLKIIHNLGIKNVVGLGVTCLREIEQCLKEIGL